MNTEQNDRDVELKNSYQFTLKMSQIVSNFKCKIISSNYSAFQIDKPHRHHQNSVGAISYGTLLITRLRQHSERNRPYCGLLK